MNKELFIDFYNQYYERTLRILCKKFGNINTAEDKTQEIFTDIYKNSPDNPKAYLWACIRHAREESHELYIENSELDFRTRIENELSVDFKECWDKIKRMEFLGSDTCALEIFFCYIEEDSKKSEIAQRFNLDFKTLSARVSELKKRIIIAIDLLQGDSLEKIIEQRELNLSPQKITKIYQQIEKWLKENSDE